MILFIVFGVFSLMWSIDQKSTLTAIITYSISALLYFLIINSISSIKELSWAMLALVICGSLIILVGFLEIKTGIIGRFSGITRNANLTLLWCIATFPGFYFYYVTKHSRLTRVLILCAVALLIWFSLLTLSRGGFISLLALFGLIILFKFRKPKVLIALIIAAIIFYSIAPEQLWSRFETIETEKGGRIEDLWPSGLHALEDSPMIGYGLGTSSIIIGKELGQKSSPHSGPLTVAIDLGGTGLVFYLLFFLLPPFQAVKKLRAGSKFKWGNNSVVYNLHTAMLVIFLAIMINWFKGGGMENSKIIFVYLGFLAALNRMKVHPE
jgi:O-antigen ligase